MAFVTELGDAFGGEHSFCLGAVGVVAVGTLDLAFNDGMMRHLVGIGTGVLVAAEANRGLFNCGAGRMNVMAGDTGYIILLVCAHIPQGKVGCFLVAAQAHLAEFIGGATAAFAKGNYILLGWVVFMLVGWRMAGLAIIFALPDFCMK
jgi:hypothetical protein